MQSGISIPQKRWTFCPCIHKFAYKQVSNKHLDSGMGWWKVTGEGKDLLTQILDDVICEHSLIENSPLEFLEKPWVFKWTYYKG